MRSRTRGVLSRSVIAALGAKNCNSTSIFIETPQDARREISLAEAPEDHWKISLAEALEYHLTILDNEIQKAHHMEKSVGHFPRKGGTLYICLTKDVSLFRVSFPTCLF